MCSAIDYTANNCLSTSGSFVCNQNKAAVKETIEHLGLAACFFGNNGTAAFNGQHGGLCKAVHAFIKTTDELTKTFPKGPGLANHDVIEWSTKTVAAWAQQKDTQAGPYSSWRTNGMDATPASNTTYQATDQDPGCCAGNATYKDMGNPYNYNAVTGCAPSDTART